MRADPEEEAALAFRQAMAAGTLGLAMAAQAVVILDRHLDLSQLSRVNAKGTVDFDCHIPAPDGPVFTAILEAAVQCRGVFDHRPPNERRWDALLELIDLAEISRRDQITARSCAVDPAPPRRTTAAGRTLSRCPRPADSPQAVPSRQRQAALMGSAHGWVW